MHTNNATELARMAVSKLVAEVAYALVLLLKYIWIQIKPGGEAVRTQTLQQKRSGTGMRALLVP